MLAQRTLKSLTTAVGVGLHSGQRVELTLRPAAPNTGIVFRRVDLTEPVEIPVNATAVTDTRLASTISNGGAKVHTIEHLMSACSGLGIDNLMVDITAEEVPIDQVVGAAVTKQLAFVFFMEGHAVLREQGSEVLWRVTRQRRAAKVRVLADEVFVGRAWVEVAVGEVGATAARDADFFGHFGAVVQHQDAQPPLTSDAGTKQTCGACADHHCVPCVHGG